MTGRSHPPAVVQAHGVGVRYGARAVLDHVGLQVGGDEQVALTGRSGSGKTTLLLVLAGLITPTSGAVEWPDLAIEARARRAQIGMVFQAPSLMPELTALQNVELPLRLRGTSREAARDSAQDALRRVSAEAFVEALPAQLSGGQQQRVAIARAIAGNHRLVLADEPTGALDRAHAHEVVEALRDGVRAGGGALVVATHDPAVAEVLGRRLVLVDGVVAETEPSR